MTSMRAAFSLLFVLVGCKSDPTPKSDAPRPSESADLTNAMPPAPPPGSAITPATLPARFAEDAANRPKGIVTAEQTWRWLESELALHVTEQKQHLSGPFHARYCQGAKAAGDLHFSVCEYTTEDDAKAGVIDASAFGVESRRIVRNGRTVLIVRYPGGYDIDRLEKGFVALQPKA